MNEKLKKKVTELVEIAKECPENLQEKCFELLLKDFLDNKKAGGAQKTSQLDIPKTGLGGDAEKSDSDESKPQQNDFEEKDLHVKAKRFLKAHGLTIAHINQVFYKEGDKILPLFDDLKTTKASESQLRIGMLQALKNGIRFGDFEFDGEEVREEAQMRKCYDQANFAAIFKYNKGLFENFTGYKRTSPKVRLSAEGKTMLAEIIKSMQ